MADVKSKGIAVTTDLSPRDLGQLEATLPTFGKAGLELLAVIRAMADAAQSVSTLGVELKLTLEEGANAETSGADALVILGLSARVYNILHSYRILTIPQLTAKTREQLLDLRSFGHSSLREVVRALADRSLSLRKQG